MIEIKNLTKTYGKGEGSVAALKGVTLTVNDHDFVAIVGKSGSGKTTLLNLIGGLDIPDSGTVKHGSEEITGWNDAKLADFRLRHVGFVFQFFDLLPELTAAENILLPAKLAGEKPKDYDAIVERLELKDRLTHYPSELSGGQQQRTAIARALINSPDVVLCDEPTGALDSKTAAEIMALLKQLNEDGKTVIIVTHDQGIAKQCGRVIELQDGEIVQETAPAS